MSPKIDFDLTRHIGLLSRLELSDDEVQALADHLAHILQYVDKLQELDTDDVEPMAHPYNLQNVFRPDEARPSLPPQEALANAPKAKANFFRVPRVIDEA